MLSVFGWGEGNTVFQLQLASVEKLGLNNSKYSVRRSIICKFVDMNLTSSLNELRVSLTLFSERTYSTNYAWQLPAQNIVT